MKIGVLDFGDLTNIGHINDVVEGVVSYAQRAEKLGFSRFWLSEHHPKSLLWSNPMMMLSILCTQTSRIQIGAGGILSAFHSPYLVYDYFKQLAIVFPDRIDLGFANGNPAPNIQQLLLNRQDVSDVARDKLYEDNVIKTIQLLMQQIKDEFILPLNFTQPNRWVLTSSCGRLELALRTGSDVCFSTFHSTVDVASWKDEILSFKEAFFHKHGRLPRVMLAFAGIIRDTQRKAEKKYLQEYNSKYHTLSSVLAGTADALQEKLYHWKREAEIDEFLFKDVETGSKERKHTLKLISKIL